MSLLEEVVDAYRRFRSSERDFRYLHWAAAATFLQSLLNLHVLYLLYRWIHALIYHQPAGLVRVLPLSWVIPPATVVEPTHLFLVTALWIYGVLGVRLLVGYGASLLLVHQRNRITQRLRERYTEGVLGAGRSLFVRHSGGHLGEVLQNTVRGVAQRIDSLHGLLNAGLHGLVYLALIAWISVPLALLLLALLPLSHGPVRWILPRLRRAQGESHGAKVALFQRTLSGFEGTLEIQSYSRTEQELQALRALGKREQSSVFWSSVLAKLVPPLKELMTTTGLLAMAVILSAFGGADSLKPDKVLISLFVGMKLFPVMGAFFAFRKVYSETEPSFREFDGIEAELRKTSLHFGGAEFPGLRHQLQVKGLWFRYVGGPWVLRGVDLTLKRGEFYVLKGPSGAGKSTLACLIAGMEEPPPGTLFVDDRDLRELNRSDYLRSVAWVGQDAHLFPGTVRENLLVGAAPAEGNVRFDAVIDGLGLRALIERLPDGLDTDVGERGRRLSGGERQRVALARSLLKDPSLLVLDEATSALDADGEAATLNTLRKLCPHASVLLITHRPERVEGADGVFHLEGGGLVSGEGASASATAQGLLGGIPPVLHPLDQV